MQRQAAAKREVTRNQEFISKVHIMIAFTTYLGLSILVSPGVQCLGDDGDILELALGPCPSRISCVS